MNKLELEKNVLDLSYQRNLQILNSVLIIFGGGFVAYLAALIIEPSNVMKYTLLLAALGLILFLLYLKFDNNLKNISSQIRKLN